MLDAQGNVAQCATFLAGGLISSLRSISRATSKRARSCRFPPQDFEKSALAGRRLRRGTLFLDLVPLARTNFERPIPDGEEGLDATRIEVRTGVVA